MDMGELWRGDVFFDPQNKMDFFVRPYNEDLEVFRKYRKIFDDMYYYSDRAKEMNNMATSAKNDRMITQNTTRPTLF
jgi:hypothetical protein